MQITKTYAQHEGDEIDTNDKQLNSFTNAVLIKTKVRLLLCNQLGLIARFTRGQEQNFQCRKKNYFVTFKKKLYLEAN